jgi:hypothetical protein
MSEEPALESPGIKIVIKINKTIQVTKINPLDFMVTPLQDHKDKF